VEAGDYRREGFPGVEGSENGMASWSHRLPSNHCPAWLSCSRTRGASIGTMGTQGSPRIETRRGYRVKNGPLKRTLGIALRKSAVKFGDTVRNGQYVNKLCTNK
jgi:hypothetical protein